MVGLIDMKNVLEECLVMEGVPADEIQIGREARIAQWEYGLTFILARGLGSCSYLSC